MLKYLAFILLLCNIAFSQSWSGIVAPARAMDWSKAGLPATLPSGETTSNPWTPPIRTQCVTTQCNTVSGGSVTASTLSAAVTSAPNGTYVLIPSGTFALGGNITITRSNVSIRGSGAGVTKLTGGSIDVGNGGYGGGSLLTAAPARGDTVISVSSPPSAGRLVSIEQCADGFSAANATFTNSSNSGSNCAGSYSDPLGPWVCGLSSICDNNGGGHVNHRYQAHVDWVPAGGVSGSNVTLTTPIVNTTWSTARTVALTWVLNSTSGIGLEGFTLEGTTTFTGTYACWIKGMRYISTTSGKTILQFNFDSHALIANNYIGETQTSTGNYLIQMGSDSGFKEQSFALFINNILEGGFPAGVGDELGIVLAYNYERNGGNNSFMQRTAFEHHAGTSYLLKEGNQMGRNADDNTWGTHNFNTWFRNYLDCSDPDFSSLGASPYAIAIDGWSRFENVIGNAFGGGSQCGTSYSSIVRINGNASDPSGLTTASLMSWGNYVQCTGDSRCSTTSSAIFASSGVPTSLATWPNSVPYQNSVPASNTLPASFYMNSMGKFPAGGTGLNWWKTCDTWGTFPTNCSHFTTPPMPTVGPDVTGGPYLGGHAYDNPAAIAWASLPTDSNYPTAWGRNLKQFDERVFQNDPAGSTPQFTISPAPFNFGGVNNGSSSSAQTFTITNTGSATGTVSSFSFVSGNTGDFAISAGGTCAATPFTLAASASCTKNITFSPTAAGTRTTTFTATDIPDSITGTANLNGTGIAIGPILQVSPAPFSFGTVNLGNTSPAQTFTISNSGTATGTVSTISFVGGNTSDFARTGGTCATTPFILAIGGSCTWTVTFSPGAVGARSTTLTITDVPDGLANVTSALSGTGFDPNAINIVSTTGCGPQTFPSSCQITPTGVGHLLAVCYSAYTDAGTSWTITSVTDTAGDVFSRIAATRAQNGTAANECWFASNIAAGSTSVTINTSTTQTGDMFVWEISNVTAVHVAGALSDQTASTTPSSPSLVTSTANVAIIANMHPSPGNGPTGIHAGNQFTSDLINDGMAWAHRIVSVTGTYSAQWDTPSGTFASNAVAFAATGGTATAQFTCPSTCTGLTFSPQNLSTSSAPQVITLTNPGTAALSITSIVLSGAAPGDYFQSNNCPVGASLGINSSCTINVTFTPLIASTRVASIIVTDNASDSPQTIPLTGTGVQSTNAAIVNSGVTQKGNTVLK